MPGWHIYDEQLDEELASCRLPTHTPNGGHLFREKFRTRGSYSRSRLDTRQIESCYFLLFPQHFYFGSLLAVLAAVLLIRASSALRIVRQC